MRQSDLWLAAKAVAHPEISAGEYRVGIESESPMQPAPRFVVPAGKQVEDRQRGVRHCVAVISRDRFARCFAEPCMRLGRRIAPPEDRLEMISESQIAERHRIRWVQGNRFIQQPARLGKVFPRETADMPMGPHCPIPGVELARFLALRLLVSAEMIPGAIAP